MGCNPGGSTGFAALLSAKMKKRAKIFSRASTPINIYKYEIKDTYSYKYVIYKAI